MPNTGDSKPIDPVLTENAGIILSPDAATLARAGEIIRSGGLVAFPTETVYGLGGDATNGTAVAGIFAAKGRPQFNPLIVHVPDYATAQRYGVFNADGARLAAHFWPGPLTLVVPRVSTSGISELASAGLPTLAIRVPANAVAQALLAAAERPLAAPSANRSGHVSATHATHVAADLDERVAMILDGGAALHGLESTVVDVTGETAVVLRPGAISADDIARVIGKPVRRFSGHSAIPHSPGQLESHYAPNARLRLNATEMRDGEALLAFGPIAFDAKGTVFNLSSRSNLIEAAANLFAALRALDASGPGTIAVMPIPNTGLGEAINDRLRRAAAPRG
jgi:L-threonylcarbamoyladenylate synthase